MKKKLVIVAENLYGGGVEKILQTICDNFDYTNFDVTLYSVLEQNLDCLLYPKIKSYKYIFQSLEKKANWLQRFLIKVKNKIKIYLYYHSSPNVFYKLFIREKCDFAIAFIEGYATRLVSGFPCTTRKIAWIHTDMIYNHWTAVAFRSEKEEQYIYTQFHVLACVSKRVQDSIKQKFQILNTTQVIYNPVDCVKIQELSKQDNVNYDLSNVFHILSIGRLEKVKGYDRLLKVVKRLRDDGVRFELLILGEGSERQSLEKYIDMYNLRQIVKLPGYKSNPYAYLSKCDLYVCASRAEGYNTAISEALVLGKAILSTDCSGVHEQLGDNNEYGLCVDNDEQSLYDGMKKILFKPILNEYSKKSLLRGQAFSVKENMDIIYKMLKI